MGGLTRERERAAGCSRFCQAAPEMRRGFLKGFSFSATAEASRAAAAPKNGWRGATFFFGSLLCPPQRLVLSLEVGFHPCFVIASLLISFQLLRALLTHPLSTRLSESKLDRCEREKESGIADSDSGKRWCLGNRKRFLFS